jgi:OOP family OmpA-OmpF porin
MCSSDKRRSQMRNLLIIPGIKKLTPLLFATAFLFPLSAQAEIKAGSVELSPFAGYNFFENRQNLENRPVFGGRIGYNFTENFGIEATGEFIRSEVDDKSKTFSREGQFTSPIDGVDITMYHLDLLYHFMPEGKFNPFITAGYGAAHYSPRINSKNMSDIDFGVGAKYWVADNVALRVDVRDNMIYDDQVHNIETTLGVVFRFGGNTTPAAATVAKDEAKSEPSTQPAAVKEEAPPVAEAAGAPTVLPPAAEPTPERMKYCVSLNIEYDINNADIRLQYHDEVAKVGDFMKKYPSTSAVIEGYADEVGNADYNLRLSQRRAENVVKYLEEKFGIAPSRLSAKGYGKAKPVADNSSDAGRQKNRRIDAIIDCAFDLKDLAMLPERLCMTLKLEFATDSTEIHHSDYAEVNKVGEYLKKYPTTTAVIEGHTDNTGGPEQNLKLSQRRADNVVNYLVEKSGIDRSRLSAKGYGSTRSIAYNNTSEGRQKNRRVNAIIDCVINK